MKIDVRWDKALKMRKSAKQTLHYTIPDLEKLPKKPCVYVFARCYGSTVEPIFVGQALRVRGRIKDHLNNLSLIQHIDSGPSGKRVLFIGRLKLHPGQQAGKVLKIVERALIKRSLAQGFEIFNKQGTKTPVHQIRSKGIRESAQIAPRIMLVERK